MKRRLPILLAALLGLAQGLGVTPRLPSIKKPVKRAVLRSPKDTVTQAAAGKAMAIVKPPPTNHTRLAWTREPCFFGQSNLYHLVIASTTNPAQRMVTREMASSNVLGQVTWRYATNGVWTVETNLPLFATGAMMTSVGPARFYRVGWMCNP